MNRIDIRNGATITVEKITPALADKYLGMMRSNRGLSKHLVASFASDMAARRWSLAGEPIGFSPDGELLNGQHRLRAIVQSQVSVEMFVMRHAPQDTPFDRGRSRTLGDVLRIRGMQNGNAVAAWITVHFILRTGDIGHRVTEHECDWWLSTRGEALEFGHRIISPLKYTGLGIAPTVGAILFAHPSSPERIDELAQQFATGAGLEKRSPLLTCRNYLLARRGNGARIVTIANDNRMTIAKKVLRAFQLAVENKSLAKVHLTHEGLAFFEKWHVMNEMKKQ